MMTRGPDPRPISDASLDACGCGVLPKAQGARLPRSTVPISIPIPIWILKKALSGSGLGIEVRIQESGP